MTTALAFASTVPSPAPSVPGAPRSGASLVPPGRASEPPSGRGAAEAAYVYGDSTPFPHAWNCIAAIVAAVTCGVALLEAQHALLRARAREGEVERRARTERARLAGLGESVERTLRNEGDGAPSAVVRASRAILGAALAAVEAEVGAVAAAEQADLGEARDLTAGARAHARRAFEAFAQVHDLPGTRTGFRLAPREVGYELEAVVSTPYGVEATFDVALDASAAWAKRRRVGELAPETVLHLPRESGWFAKRTELARASLDKAWVMAAAAVGDRATVVLARQPRGGAGWELAYALAGDEPRVVLHEIGEDGRRVGGAEGGLPLGGEDRGRALELLRRVRDALGEPLARRGAARAIDVDDRAFDGEEPLSIVKRIVFALAPVAEEVMRRSGAPGELVLRKNLGSGRREEIYVTVAELRERLAPLAPPLRAVFAPLGLGEDARGDVEEVSVSGVELLQG